MRYALMNSGVPVEAEFSRENIDGIFLPLLARLGAIRREKGKRALALLAAPPGAGKSTLAALLERLSGDGPEGLTALGMDGFHFPRDYLQSHEVKIDGRAVPLRELTEEERERWRESLRARLSETMSDYYARRPEEYAALG